MSKVMIIGSGPAGLSASLYAARANIDTTVISNGKSALSKAKSVENYFGFSEPVNGRDIEKATMKNAKRLGVKFIKEEVVGMNYDNGYIVKTNKNEYTADAVIIATGTDRTIPKSIKNIKKYEGKGVSFCAVCDAFFYRNKDIAVIGSGEYALNEVNELLPVAGSVTLVTNGSKVTADFPDHVKIIDKKISALEGDEIRLSSILFQDGTSQPVDGVFLALGNAGSTALAKKIGAVTVNNCIQVDEDMATNLPGLFACGDCTGGLLQIAKAIYEGAKAGIGAINYIRKLNS